MLGVKVVLLFRLKARRAFSSHQAGFIRDVIFFGRRHLGILSLSQRQDRVPSECAWIIGPQKQRSANCRINNVSFDTIAYS